MKIKATFSDVSPGDIEALFGAQVPKGVRIGYLNIEMDGETVSAAFTGKFDGRSVRVSSVRAQDDWPQFPGMFSDEQIAKHFPKEVDLYA